MQKSGIGEWIRRGALVALVSTTTMLAAGCGGGGGGGGKSAASSGNGPAPTGANTAPTIGGAPVTEASVGAAYDLTPSAQDADGDQLAFSIENRPAWATFNTATGKLTGTPTADNVGTSPGIVISVSDGKTSAALPSFSITVVAVASGTPVPADAVALTWDVPTQTVSGETLGTLSGYRIHYGTRADQLTQAIEVPSAGANTFIVRDLPNGTFYFAVRAVSGDTQSELSNVITRQIS